MNNDRIIIQEKLQGKKLQIINKNASQSIESQYKEQRARGAYIAAICQPEASFGLSVAAQIQEPSQIHVTTLKKCLQWQIDNIDRGLTYISLDLSKAKIFTFVDSSFANNNYMSSQISYCVVIANERFEDSPVESPFKLRGNLVHWSSTKCKRVTRSVLASEVYGMVGGVDICVSIKTTINKIMKALGLNGMEIVVGTDSKSLYEFLVKLGSTNEKRLMIDFMALRQSYERRGLQEICWIDGRDNIADSMTEARANTALEQFVDTNEITIRTNGWVY